MTVSFTGSIAYTWSMSSCTSTYPCLSGPTPDAILIRKTAYFLQWAPKHAGGGGGEAPMAVTCGLHLDTLYPPIQQHHSMLCSQVCGEFGIFGCYGFVHILIASASGDLWMQAKSQFVFLPLFKDVLFSVSFGCAQLFFLVRLSVMLAHPSPMGVTSMCLLSPDPFWPASLCHCPLVIHQPTLFLSTRTACFSPPLQAESAFLTLTTGESWSPSLTSRRQMAELTRVTLEE